MYSAMKVEETSEQISAWEEPWASLLPSQEFTGRRCNSMKSFWFMELVFILGRACKNPVYHALIAKEKELGVCY